MGYCHGSSLSSTICHQLSAGWSISHVPRAPVSSYLSTGSSSRELGPGCCLGRLRSVPLSCDGTECPLVSPGPPPCSWPMRRGEAKASFDGANPLLVHLPFSSAGWQQLWRRRQEKSRWKQHPSPSACDGERCCLPVSAPSPPPPPGSLIQREFQTSLAGDCCCALFLQVTPTDSLLPATSVAFRFLLLQATRASHHHHHHQGS